MNTDAKEKRLLRQELVMAHARTDAHEKNNVVLVDVIHAAASIIGKQNDTITQLEKDNASLERQQAIYTNADSPSGKDPKGYEDTKKFRAMAKAYEEAKEENGEDDGKNTVAKE